MSKNINILKGGALIGALLITAGTSVLAYDQHNTHPALTDEIVDFYNLSFPDRKIIEQEKQWLIQGSVDEDNDGRSMSHFYDPVHNKGIQSVYTAYLPMATAKDWALGNGTQRKFYNSQQTGFAAISDAPSNRDFSYQRALDDYAKGDKQRAFTAFGHTLHLLEDMGVPDHTRNDAHPSWEESPYEKEMAKWNSNNLQVARKIFLTREKPVGLDSMAEYFDRMANYSNSNFFSKDTISNKEYSLPKLTSTRKININGKNLLFTTNKDEKGKEY
ncbi:MAG: hypothetical protein WD989_00460, partial [Candidatus Paceibacterota bacterium]